MDHSNRLLINELNDRTLWYDGDSVLPVERVTQMIMEGKDVPPGICVDTVTKDIKQFNQFVPKAKQLKTKQECRTPFDFSWDIPQEYLELDVDEYVAKRLIEQQVTGASLAKRLQRVNHELDLYEHHNLTRFLQTLVYVINTLLSSDVPWGVGRGSSVSSYVLFLIGVHDVDSVEYDLDIADFLPPIT